VARKRIRAATFEQNLEYHAGFLKRVREERAIKAEFDADTASKKIKVNRLRFTDAYDMLWLSEKMARAASSPKEEYESMQRQIWGPDGYILTRSLLCEVRKIRLARWSVPAISASADAVVPGDAVVPATPSFADAVVP
jgi:hypothetical protein